MEPWGSQILFSSTSETQGLSKDRSSTFAIPSYELNSGEKELYSKLESSIVRTPRGNQTQQAKTEMGHMQARRNIFQSFDGRSFGAGVMRSTQRADF